MVKFLCGVILIGMGILFYNAIQEANKNRQQRPVVTEVKEQTIKPAEKKHVEIKPVEPQIPAHEFPPQELAKEQAKQPRREKLIQDLMRDGYIKNSSSKSNHPHYNVTAKFKALDYDDKKQFAIAIWSYFAVQTNNKEIMLFLDDAVSGKNLGGYNSFVGFEW